jgi:drug/metabolite transporter (DMT)-like permease
MNAGDPEFGSVAAAGETVLLRHRAGILLAGVVLSLGGLLIRMIETATPWQILFYRSGFLAIFLVLYLVWRERDRLIQYLAATSGAALLGGVCIGSAMTGFIYSVTHTTVANTLFILAASPFVAAALGWFALRERVHARTWLTMLAAALGIGVMVYDGIGDGHLVGLLAALGATFGFAGLTVILRWKRQADLIAAVLYGAILSSLVGAIVTLPEGFAIPLADVGWCVLYGGPVLVLGFILLTHGGRFVPAAEVTLLSLSEVALGPVWVWLVVDETPSKASLIGGTLVLAAVVVQVLLGGRQRHPPIPLD